MTVWRMSLRQGSQGHEMWPICFECGVIAISYEGTNHLDLSRYSEGEPAKVWSTLYSAQSASLRRVVHEMRRGDVIYVKQGPEIVGRGRVTGGYKYKLNKRIVDADDDLWPHQRPVKWEPDFEPFRLLLGAEALVVKKLDERQVRQLEKGSQAAAVQAQKAAAEEGRTRTATVHFRKRNRAPVQAKKHNAKRCEICRFSFREVYGMGEPDGLQVHHKTPLAEQQGKTVTSLADLVVVCPNCHAAMHSTRPALSADDVRYRIRCTW